MCKGQAGGGKEETGGQDSLLWSEGGKQQGEAGGKGGMVKTQGGGPKGDGMCGTSVGGRTAASGLELWR